MTASELLAASEGKLKQCDLLVSACIPRYAGYVPDYFVDDVTTLGLPAAAGFSFDEQGHLKRTVLLFSELVPTADQLLEILNKAYGRQAKEEGSPTRSITWQDRQGETSITLFDMSPNYITVEYRPIEKK